MFREVSCDRRAQRPARLLPRPRANAGPRKWVSQPEHLSGLMERIDCRMGHTQIGKVLAHAKRETELLKVQALVFVGDAMEENPDELAHDAGELWAARRAGLHVPGGPRSRCRAGLPRDRSADAWRLLPLRSRRSTPTGRASARRGGLCRRWDDRTRCSPRCGRSQAAEPDEISRRCCVFSWIINGLMLKDDNKLRNASRINSTCHFNQGVRQP